MSTTAAAATERSDVPERYRWDLTPVYPDWDAWERDFEAVSDAADVLAGLQGVLGGGAADLLRVTETLLDAHRRFDLVRLYASLRSDEDTRVGDHTERRGRASTLGVKLAEAGSWYEPELLELDDAVLEGLARGDAGAARLRALLRRHPAQPPAHPAAGAGGPAGRRPERWPAGRRRCSARSTTRTSGSPRSGTRTAPWSS